MCAAQCLGGIPVPLYQDAVATEMAFPIQNAEIALRLRRRPGAGRQAARDPAAVPDAEAHRTTTTRAACATTARRELDELRRPAGEAAARRCSAIPRFLEAEIAKGAGSDTAAMFFTSGTTGDAEGRGAHPPCADRPRAGGRRAGEPGRPRRGARLPAAGVDRPDHLLATRSRSSPAIASAAPSRPRR